jgi:hypothetical protein
MLALISGTGGGSAIGTLKNHPSDDWRVKENSGDIIVIIICDLLPTLPPTGGSHRSGNATIGPKPLTRLDYPGILFS